MLPALDPEAETRAAASMRPPRNVNLAAHVMAEGPDRADERQRVLEVTPVRAPTHRGYFGIRALEHTARMGDASPITSRSRVGTATGTKETAEAVKALHPECERDAILTGPLADLPPHPAGPAPPGWRNLRWRPLVVIQPPGRMLAQVLGPAYGVIQRGDVLSRAGRAKLRHSTEPRLDNEPRRYLRGLGPEESAVQMRDLPLLPFGEPVGKEEARTP